MKNLKNFILERGADMFWVKELLNDDSCEKFWTNPKVDELLNKYNYELMLVPQNTDICNALNYRSVVASGTYWVLIKVNKNTSSMIDDIDGIDRVIPYNEEPYLLSSEANREWSSNRTLRENVKKACK